MLQKMFDSLISKARRITDILRYSINPCQKEKREENHPWQLSPQHSVLRQYSPAASRQWSSHIPSFPKQHGTPYRLTHCAKRNRTILRHSASIFTHFRTSSPLLEVTVQIKWFTWASVNINGDSARRKKIQHTSQGKALYITNLGKPAVSTDLPRYVHAWV